MNVEDVEADVPNLAGSDYLVTLSKFHELFHPRNYLEIGVATGASLALSRCNSIGIDPFFTVSPGNMAGVFSKPELHLFQVSSDEFFRIYDPKTFFNGNIDFAFLDGMHRCEYLLRDFLNTERHCSTNSVIALHDCLPVEAGITTRSQANTSSIRSFREAWWTGDVWRTSLLLKRFRPDLRLTVLNSSPTGLVLITNLDSSNDVLSRGYRKWVDEMLSWDLQTIGIQNLFDEMEVEADTIMNSHELATERFWL